jgi:PST family polysaccharide transporter
MPWGDYLGAIRPALTGCLVMVFAVEIVKHFLASGFPLPFRLAAEVVAGGLAYIVTLTLFHRERFAIFWKFVKALRTPASVNVVAEETVCI